MERKMKNKREKRGIGLVKSETATAWAGEKTVWNGGEEEAERGREGSGGGRWMEVGRREEGERDGAGRDVSAGRGNREGRGTERDGAAAVRGNGEGRTVVQ